MIVHEVPLSPEAQRFSISLAGVTYNLRLQWCDPAGCWMMDINDAGGNALLAGAPLLTGTDILAQFDYLGIGGALTVQTDNDALALPTYANLGETSHLYFVTQ